jgi:hypothetical protein
MDNLVAIQMSPEDQKTCADAIKTMTDTLKPYMISLKPEQRITLPKMKDKTSAFVSKALDYAESNPQFAPSYLDIPGLRIDVEAVNMLNNLFRPLEQIYTMLDDSILQSGSEAYVAALSFYNAVKQAAKNNVPGAQPIYDDLSKRFPGRSTKKTTPDETES